MTDMEALPKRKSHRLKRYDYSQNGYYFVTLCTADKKAIFRKTVGADISTVIGQMKRLASKQTGISLWQKSFYDEIIRNQAAYDEISKYVYENPMKWEKDELFCE